MPLPRMRPLEVAVVETEDKQPVVTLRDPEGICEETVMLAPAAFMVASLFDGKREAKEIQGIFARQQGGAILTEADIKEVRDQLDKYGLLETESYRKKKEKVEAEFAAMPNRPAIHAGSSYSADRLELLAMVRDAMKALPSGGLVLPEGVRTLPRGLVVPHIDFARGARVYGSAHKTHAEGKLPPLVVVMGVAHSAPPEPFILTRKAFETPLGLVETDREAVDELEKASGLSLTGGEYAHRQEHSVEFQLVWLKALHLDENFKVLPILVSAFEQFTGQASPLYDERVAKAIMALREMVRKRGALVVASVDMSHVGPRFGDQVEVNDALREGVRASDRALLEAALGGDSEAFWVEGLRDGNERHVDALSAVYALLRILAPTDGAILDYDTADDPAGGVVGFGAVSFK